MNIAIGIIAIIVGLGLAEYNRTGNRKHSNVIAMATCGLIISGMGCLLYNFS